MAVDRNTQINFQGDPAKEQEFINNQEPRTAEGARASESQIAATQEGNDSLLDSIRSADILDPHQGEGYEAADAPPGAEAGANVNAEFEDDVRTGADESGDKGDAGDGNTTPLLTGGHDEEGNPQAATLKGEDEQGQTDVVETGDEARDSSKKKGKK